MALSPLVVRANTVLTAADTAGRTSTLGEPSVAKNDDVLFATGNWYAARSADSGATWTPVDPFSVLPPVDGGFCCDQTAINIVGHGMFVWLLQYFENAGTNTLRVAVKMIATIADDRWTYWDLRPEKTDPLWTNQWFDYNHVARSNGFLYVATNVFEAGTNQWKRAVVFRIPLTALANAGALTYDVFTTTSNGSLRLTQGATSVMYFGSHNSHSQIRLFSWPESSKAVTTTDINVTGWAAGAYSSACPDGRNWLGRCDGRITGGWTGNGQIGFAWSANTLGAARPHPYVRVAQIDEQSKTLVAEPDLWHPDFSYAYADAHTNDVGDVGLSLFRGGGTRFPGHVVGAWNSDVAAWELIGTRDSTHSPNDGKWGDFVTCRRDAPAASGWVAAGYTLQGGGDRSNIEPCVVRFGR